MLSTASKLDDIKQKFKGTKDIQEMKESELNQLFTEGFHEF